MWMKGIWRWSADERHLEVKCGRKANCQRIYDFCEEVKKAFGKRTTLVEAMENVWSRTLVRFIRIFLRVFGIFMVHVLIWDFGIILLVVVSFLFLVFHYGCDTLFVVNNVFPWNKGKSFLSYLLNQVCSSFEESKSFEFDGRLDVLAVAEVF